MIMLILRYAWLNLWDKHMTTGRINQVSKNQLSMQKHQKLNLHTNLHPMRSASCRTWAQRILLSSHLFKRLQLQHAYYMSLIEATWRSNKRISTHCNSMRNSEFIKSTNTNSQTRRNSEELQAWKAVPSNSHLLIHKRSNTNAELKNFFNAKTYTSEFNNFRCSILLPLHETSSGPLILTSSTGENYLVWAILQLRTYAVFWDPIFWAT